jgi:hypothetical protein
LKRSLDRLWWKDADVNCFEDVLPLEPKVTETLRCKILSVFRRRQRQAFAFAQATVFSTQFSSSSVSILIGQKLLKKGLPVKMDALMMQLTRTLQLCKFNDLFVE